MKLQLLFFISDDIIPNDLQAMSKMNVTQNIIVTILRSINKYAGEIEQQGDSIPKQFCKTKFEKPKSKWTIWKSFVHFWASRMWQQGGSMLLELRIYW